MAKYGKWIGGAVGWALGGPIGGLLGFFIGSFFDGNSVATKSHRDDFIRSFLVLSAAVMKADEKIKKSELEFVKQFLLANFGKEHTLNALQILKELLNKDIPLNEVCDQIKINMPHSSKLQLIHYLFGIANADGHIDDREINVIAIIAERTGLSQTEFNSVKNMFIKNTDSAYKILGISKSASIEEIKTAYRKMAITYHPDKVSNLGDDVQEAAKQKFQKVNEAYNQIKKERNFV